MIYPQIYFQIFGLFKYFKPATHLVILYADHDEFDHRRLLPSIDADTHTDIFRRSQQCGSFEKSCDKIAQSDGLALLAICSNDHRKSRNRHRYLTCQISAILYADHGERLKSQWLHRAHLAIFVDHGDRCIKSPSVSLALLPHENQCKRNTTHDLDRNKQPITLDNIDHCCRST